MRASAGPDRNNELVMLTGAGKVPRFECVGFGDLSKSVRASWLFPAPTSQDEETAKGLFLCLLASSLPALSAQTFGNV